MTSTLLVRAPPMPSLNAPVMRLLAARMSRLTARMRRWKYTVASAMGGTMQSTSSARPAFSAAMTANAPTT
jgi:hypothetical protein